MSHEKGEHVVARNVDNGYLLECLNCHDTYRPALPCSIDLFLSIVKAFKKQHKDCQMDNAEKIGRLADKVDSLIAATEIPMTPEFHLKNLVVELKRVSTELKEIYQSVTGKNPWEGG